MKDLVYEKSARHDPSLYLMFLVGGLFAVLAVVVPKDSMSESISYWFLSIFGIFGALLVVGSVVALIRNAKQGVSISKSEGTMSWWVTGSAYATGSVPIDDIMRIEVVHVHDSSDRIYFYNKIGERLLFPIPTMLPYDLENWAQSVNKIFPHIRIEVREQD